MTDRLNLYLSDDLAALITERSATPQSKNAWVTAALQRYADIVKEDTSWLYHNLTDDQAKEIIQHTTNRAYDHDTVHSLILNKTKDNHVIALLHEISLPQRCALAEACDRYHRRRLAGEDVQPTLDELFA